MIRIAKHFSVLSVLIFLSACETVPVEPFDYSAFESAAPRSVLVVPVVNESLEVDAGIYMLSTLPLPLGESGYYVFPVNTVKVVLEQEGFYEADQVQAQPPEQLAELFGADAVLFVKINRWDAQYALISTTVTVGVDYIMYAKDGTEIWSESILEQYTPQSNSNTGLLGALISAAVARVAPNYMPLARQANTKSIRTGNKAIPAGPFSVPES